MESVVHESARSRFRATYRQHRQHRQRRQPGIPRPVRVRPVRRVPTNRRRYAPVSAPRVRSSHLGVPRLHHRHRFLTGAVLNSGQPVPDRPVGPSPAPDRLRSPGPGRPPALGRREGPARYSDLVQRTRGRVDRVPRGMAGLVAVAKAVPALEGLRRRGQAARRGGHIAPMTGAAPAVISVDRRAGRRTAILAGLAPECPVAISVLACVQPAPVVGRPLRHRRPPAPRLSLGREATGAASAASKGGRGPETRSLVPGAMSTWGGGAEVGDATKVHAAAWHPSRSSPRSCGPPRLSSMVR